MSRRRQVLQDNARAVLPLLSEDGNGKEVCNEEVEREEKRFEEHGVEGNGEARIRKEDDGKEESDEEDGCQEIGSEEECVALGEARDEVVEHENRCESPAHYRCRYEQDPREEEREGGEWRQEVERGERVLARL